MMLALQEKIEKKMNTSSAKLNFEELTEKWLLVYEKQVRATTYETNNYSLKQVLKKIGHVSLENLTAAIINRALLEFFDQGSLFTTVNDKKKLIIRILNYGIKYGYMSDITLPQQVSIPRINVSKKNDFKYLERYELESVLNQLKDMDRHEEARLSKLQVYTGMRFNELVSLNYKDDIDFENKTIEISKSYSPSKKEFFLPKNNKSRTIHFNQQMLELIQEQIVHDQKKMLINNLSRQNTLLFRTEFDNPYPLKSMNKFLKRIDLPSNKHLSTHIFRHTLISLMVEHVGHSNTEMIEKIYSHFTKTMNRRLKEAVNNIQIL